MLGIIVISMKNGSKNELNTIIILFVAIFIILCAFHLVAFFFSRQKKMERAHHAVMFNVSDIIKVVFLRYVDEEKNFHSKVDGSKTFVFLNYRPTNIMNFA